MKWQTNLEEACMQNEWGQKEAARTLSVFSFPLVVPFRLLASSGESADSFIPFYVVDA